MTDEPNVTELDTMILYGRGWRPVPKQFALHERGWRQYQEGQRREAEAAQQEAYSPYAAAWRVNGVKRK